MPGASSMIVALRYTVKATIGLKHVQHALASAALFRRNNSTWNNTSSETFSECLQMHAKRDVQDKQHTQNVCTAEAVCVVR